MNIGFHPYVANDDNNDWQMFYLDITDDVLLTAKASDNPNSIMDNKK